MVFGSEGVGLKCMEGDVQGECEHALESQRGWHCTLNSVDLEAALEDGYRVPRCYTVFDWDVTKTRTDLFTQMIKV